MKNSKKITKYLLLGAIALISNVSVLTPYSPQVIRNLKKNVIEMNTDLARIDDLSRIIKTANTEVGITGGSLKSHDPSPAPQAILYNNLFTHIVGKTKEIVANQKEIIEANAAIGNLSKLDNLLAKAAEIHSTLSPSVAGRCKVDEDDAKKLYQGILGAILETPQLFRSLLKHVKKELLGPLAGLIENANAAEGHIVAAQEHSQELRKQIAALAAEHATATAAIRSDLEKQLKQTEALERDLDATRNELVEVGKKHTRVLQEKENETEKLRINLVNLRSEMAAKETFLQEELKKAEKYALRISEETTKAERYLKEQVSQLEEKLQQQLNKNKALSKTLSNLKISIERGAQKEQLLTQIKSAEAEHKVNMEELKNIIEKNVKGLDQEIQAKLEATTKEAEDLAFNLKNLREDQAIKEQELAQQAESAIDDAEHLRNKLATVKREYGTAIEEVSAQLSEHQEALGKIANGLDIDITSIDQIANLVVKKLKDANETLTALQRDLDSAKSDIQKIKADLVKEQAARKSAEDATKREKARRRREQINSVLIPTMLASTTAASLSAWNENGYQDPCYANAAMYALLAGGGTLALTGASRLYQATKDYIFG